MIQPPRPKKARSQNHNLNALNSINTALFELRIWGNGSAETKDAQTLLKAAKECMDKELKHGKN